MGSKLGLAEPLLLFTANHPSTRLLGVGEGWELGMSCWLNESQSVFQTGFLYVK